MLELLQNIIQFLVSLLQTFNSALLSYSGILQLGVALFAIAAYRKASKVEGNREAMQRLADAIIRQQAEETR